MEGGPLFLKVVKRGGGPSQVGKLSIFEKYMSCVCVFVHSSTRRRVLKDTDTIDRTDLVIMRGYSHIWFIHGSLDPSLRNGPNVQRAIIQCAVNPMVIKVVPSHVHETGAIDEARDDAVRNPPGTRGLKNGDFASRPGQGHRHPPQVRRHNVRLRRGRLAQTLQVLKPLGFDCVSLSSYICSYKRFKSKSMFPPYLEMFKFCGPPKFLSLDAVPDTAPWSDLRQEEAVLLKFSRINRHNSINIVIPDFPQFQWLPFGLVRKRLSWLNGLCLRITHNDARLTKGFSQQGWRENSYISTFLRWV